jgi:hypothetical protein
MKRLIICFFSLTFACAVFSAEVRIWEDRDGNQYEAEFVRELFDILVLRDLNGKEHQLAVEDLSEHDQKYIRVMVPPVMEIDFSKKTRFKPKPIELSDSDDDITILLTGTVCVYKKSKRPFTSRLKAEVYFIAEEVDGDNFILLERAGSDFLFTDQDTYEFTTDEIEFASFRAITGQRRGEEYLGYLVAVLDARDNILLVKTDIPWLEDKAGKLRELYLRGAASRFVRNFDKNVEKTEVPRPHYLGGRPEPRRYDR